MKPLQKQSIPRVLRVRDGVMIIGLTFVLPLVICSIFGCKLGDLELRIKEATISDRIVSEASASETNTVDHSLIP